VQGVVERNVVTPGFFIRGAVGGLVVAMGCAVAWAALVRATKIEFGIVASFIGVAVGKAVVASSGKRRGPALQWLAAVLSVVGIVGGKLTYLGWIITDGLANRGKAVTLESVDRVFENLIMNHASVLVTPFDLLWLGLAIYAAWRLTKAPKITIAGPFPIGAGGGAGMQFETAERTGSPAGRPSPPPLPERP
jgi:hypothetical protein